MSLKEFPLDLIPVRNIEVGLDGDDGSGILFPSGSGSDLDVHGGRGAEVETVGRGKSRRTRGECDLFIEVYISGGTLGDNSAGIDIVQSHHQRSCPESIRKAGSRLNQKHVATYFMQSHRLDRQMPLYREKQNAARRTRDTGATTR